MISDSVLAKVVASIQSTSSVSPMAVKAWAVNFSSMWKMAQLPRIWFVEIHSILWILIYIYIYIYEDFFDKLKEAYRALQLIPCPGRIPIDADRVGEADECLRITQGEVLAQERDWGTDLDIQYIRQLYRQYGWPNNFQKNIATKALNDLMVLIEEQRGNGWESTADWDRGM